jgi:hypothetical protein
MEMLFAINKKTLTVHTQFHLLSRRARTAKSKIERERGECTYINSFICFIEGTNCELLKSKIEREENEHQSNLHILPENPRK